MSQPPPTPAPSPASKDAPPTLRIVPLDAAHALAFQFDGRALAAAPGETIAVALLAAGEVALRTSARLAEARGVFCNMGVCFECLVEVDGQANVRACQTVVTSGMSVRTQHGKGRAVLPAEPAR